MEGIKSLYKFMPTVHFRPAESSIVWN